MIKQENIKEMIQTQKDEGFCTNYNCWGATLYALGQKDKTQWISENEMKKWIKKSTTEISSKSLKIGDVLVISAGKELHLIHTAVYIGNGKWFHKQGKFKLSFHCKTKVIELYTTDIALWNKGSPVINILRLNS